MDGNEPEIDELPELETAVAVYGSAEQAEVGGDVCVGIAIATYLFNHA